MDPAAQNASTAAARVSHALVDDSLNPIDKIAYTAALLNSHRVNVVLDQLDDDSTASYQALFSDTELVNAYRLDFPFPRYCLAIISGHFHRNGARQPLASIDPDAEERARRTWDRINNVRPSRRELLSDLINRRRMSSRLLHW